MGDDQSLVRPPLALLVCHWRFSLAARSSQGLTEWFSLSAGLQYHSGSLLRIRGRGCRDRCLHSAIVAVRHGQSPQDLEVSGRQ